MYNKGELFPILENSRLYCDTNYFQIPLSEAVICNCSVGKCQSLGIGIHHNHACTVNFHTQYLS